MEYTNELGVRGHTYQQTNEQTWRGTYIRTHEQTCRGGRTYARTNLWWGRTYERTNERTNKKVTDIHTEGKCSALYIYIYISANFTGNIYFPRLNLTKKFLCPTFIKTIRTLYIMRTIV